jgi:selenide,water dikinase
MPVDTLPPDVIRTILLGGAAKVKEAGCVLVGGHSIKNPEPIYGLSVTGLVDPCRLITNAAARAGDLLVLTKPLGTGIVSTGIKREKTPPRLARRAIRAMCRLNSVGAELGEHGLVRAGTDVTGFGLLGHLGSICRASGVGAELHAHAVPVLGCEVWTLIADACVPGGSRGNLVTAGEFTEWAGVSEAQKLLLADAQTSGGLLLCVAPRRLDAVRALLQRRGALCAAVVGRVVRSARPRILVSP